MLGGKVSTAHFAVLFVPTVLASSPNSGRFQGDNLLLTEEIGNGPPWPGKRVVRSRSPGSMMTRL